MKFRVAAISDKGDYRQTNQDCIYSKRINTACGQALIAVLCDGMGGMSYGEYASSTVVKAFEEWFNEDFAFIISVDSIKDMILNAWDNIVSQVNSEIFETGNNLYVQIGTTLTALLIIDDRFYCFQIGDSRLYGINDKGAVRITTDHTVVAEQVENGEISEAEALVSFQRHVLTRCIGGESVAIADFYSDRIRKYDYFLLCSDGLYDGMDENQLYSCFTEVMKHRKKDVGALNDFVALRREMG